MSHKSAFTVRHRSQPASSLSSLPSMSDSFVLSVADTVAIDIGTDIGTDTNDSANNKDEDNTITPQITRVILTGLVKP